MTETATNSLTQAWAKRWSDAMKTIRHMDRAPALFRQERVDEVLAEARKARTWNRYWSDQNEARDD